jgi:hypothetical protein
MCQNLKTLSTPPKLHWNPTYIPVGWGKGYTSRHKLSKRINPHPKCNLSTIFTPYICVEQNQLGICPLTDI